MRVFLRSGENAEQTGYFCFVIGADSGGISAGDFTYSSLSPYESDVLTFRRSPAELAGAPDGETLRLGRVVRLPAADDFETVAWKWIQALLWLAFSVRYAAGRPAPDGWMVVSAVASAGLWIRAVAGARSIAVPWPVRRLSALLLWRAGRRRTVVRNGAYNSIDN